MDSQNSNDQLIYFGRAANRECAPAPDTQPDNVELAQWLASQLETALQRLVRSVNTLVYTRNPVAMAVTAQQCDRVEQLLGDLQSLELGALAGQSRYESMQALLYIEAEGLLAEARRLVAAPLKPVRRGDNVIVLKPDYADLADAAFERMLASSDIPQLLSDGSDDVRWDEQIDYSEPQRPAVKAPHLTLVHSSDAPRKR